MRRAVEHDYELREMAWDLSPDHRRWVHNFRHGPRQPVTIDEAPARERRERRASAPKKQAPAGYVHVSDVALSMGIDAKQARVALRKIYAGNKPDIGWWFDPRELDELKAKIREVVDD